MLTESNQNTKQLEIRAGNCLPNVMEVVTETESQNTQVPRLKWWSTIYFNWLVV